MEGYEPQGDDFGDVFTRRCVGRWLFVEPAPTSSTCHEIATRYEAIR